MCVVGVITLVAAAAGAIDLSHSNWKKAGLNFVLVTISTILVAIITEEGFFRGWLWASLARAGVQQPGILIWSSIAFSLWHWSAVMLKTGFDWARAEVPVFMVNAIVMGTVWGLLRWISGSVIVSSVSHPSGTEWLTCFSVLEPKSAHSASRTPGSSALKWVSSGWL